MHPVTSQQNQNNEIRNEQRQIEAIDVVKALKGLIEEVLAEILPDALGSSQPRQRQNRQNVI